MLDADPLDEMAFRGCVAWAGGDFNNSAFCSQLGSAARAQIEDDPHDSPVAWMCKYMRSLEIKSVRAVEEKRFEDLFARLYVTVGSDSSAQVLAATRSENCLSYFAALPESGWSHVGHVAVGVPLGSEFGDSGITIGLVRNSQRFLDLNVYVDAPWWSSFDSVAQEKKFAYLCRIARDDVRLTLDNPGPKLCVSLALAEYDGDTMICDPGSIPDTATVLRRATLGI